MWVNRRGAKGPGASGAGSGVAELEVPNLKTLVQMIESAHMGGVLKSS